MSLRDTFASRLREVRKQAKDLSSKLPTFDDMAANDAYIHSEEFNVRGQPRDYEKKTRIQKGHTNLPEQRQGTTMDSIDEASSILASPSALHASMSTLGSSSAAWSLLDRPNIDSTVVDDAARNDQLDTLTAQASSTENDTTQQQDDDENNAIAAPVSTPVKPATPLLSIVADTLQDTPPVVKSINPITDSALQHLTHDDDSEEDDSSHHDDEDDEEDPILAMMQNDNDYHKRQKRTRKQKSSNKHRFMEDLDRRLEQPNDPLPIPTLEIEHGTDLSEDPAPYFTRGPFGGAVLNMAMTKLHRIVHTNNSPTSTPPPLARARPPKPIATEAPEDDFHVTTSNSVLSAGELEELKAKSLHKKTFLLHVAQLVQEHRHFAFVGFTLLLAVVVYFLTHKNLEDDVT